MSSHSHGTGSPFDEDEIGLRQTFLRRLNLEGMPIGFSFILVSGLSVVGSPLSAIAWIAPHSHASISVLLNSQRLDAESGEARSPLQKFGIALAVFTHLVCIVLLAIMMIAYFGGLDSVNEDPAEIPPSRGCPAASRNCVRWSVNPDLAYGVAGVFR